MILINRSLSPSLITPLYITNDSYNMCAISIGHHHNKTVFIVVYRAPWAKSADTIELSQLLDSIVINYSNIVITGDFNIPNWNNDTAVKLGDGQIIRNFANEHNLLQIAKSATRKLSYLDLIFNSSRFQQCYA